MKIITLADVEFVSFRLAKEFMEYDEPIPDFSTRFPNALESCLLTPFQSFDKKQLYKGLTAKASILFYLMVKNHPFQNGNKRIAVTTLLTFLHMNQKWLSVNNQELYNFTMWITQSPAKLKKETVEGIEKFLKSYLIDIKT
jgi:death-on-curing family protein